VDVRRRCPVVRRSVLWPLAAIAVAAAAAVALAGCGGAVGHHPATPTNGIDLLTVAGPTCPVQRQGQLCERPISARVLVRNPSGSITTTVQTGADGKARVPLPPGTYTIAAQSGGSVLPRAPLPATVTVTAGAFASVRMDYDTGIR
jgi:hypothetical protein